MRRMRGEHSPDQPLSTTSNELFSFKLDPFTKSFRKKHPLLQPSTINSSSSLIKTFSKNRLNHPHPPKESPTKTVERRSNSKSHLSKQIEKISLTSHAYHQPNSMSVSSKLSKISSIFSRRVEGGAAEMLARLYEQNDQYLELLLEWQKLQIYEETDRLVYRLMQSYMKILQSIMEKTQRDMNIKLQNYERLISNLVSENAQLRQEKEKSKIDEYLLGELKKRIAEEYQKNQWSNIILEQIQRSAFDFENYVKHTSTYRQIILGQHFFFDNEDYFQSRGLLHVRSQLNIRADKSQAHSMANRKLSNQEKFISKK